MKTLSATIKNTGQRFRWYVLLYALASVAATAGLIAMNRLQGDMGEAALARDVGALRGLLLLIAGVMVLRALCGAISTLLAARLAAKSGYGLRRHFVRHFLYAPLADVERTGSGEGMSIYTTDIPKSEEFISHYLLNVAAGFFTFAAGLVFLLSISVLYTAMLAGSFTVLMTVVMLVTIPMRRYTEQLSRESAKFNAVVSDSLQNLVAITAYGLDEVVEKRFANVYGGYMKAAVRLARASIPLVAVAFVALFGPIAVINVVLALGAIAGSISMAQFIAYVTTIMVVVEGISGVANGLGALHQASANAKRLGDNTADAQTRSSSAAGAAQPGAIRFDNVSFAYNDNTPPVLDCASFEITPGSKVALVGDSGSGKSTILKLLLGLYTPKAGSISVESGIAYVPQDICLFAEPIGQSITLEDEIADMPRLEQACRDAGILDFIHSLPNGFDSHLRESADNISGGQRQRIALARAFYKNAPIILFDEATSALDAALEAEILDALKRAAHGKTVVMAAHRAAAIAACDIIINIAGGKVVITKGEGSL